MGGAADQPAKPPAPTNSAGVEGAADNLGDGAASRNAPPPQLGNPFRFIELGALATLAALVMVALTLRGRYIDLGLRAGKGGTR